MTDSSPPRYPAAGTVIDGKYRIDRMLGEGGMGAVAGAFHLLRRAPVALKFISPEMAGLPGAIERFTNEAVAASQIESDHVVRIFDVGKLENGVPYIVMEMLSGRDLSELLEQEGQGGGLEPARAVHFVLQILRGLHAAHLAGIIHRDLKPSNAFVVVRDGEADFVKLLDFGISKIIQDVTQAPQNLTQTNTGLGTPLYMSPEQARNARDATPRSDLYSVSAMFFELLTGRTPYLADSPNDLLFKLFTTEPDDLRALRPDLHPGLSAIIHAGLSREPSGRPQSATELAEHLFPFADGRSASVIARFRTMAAGAGGMRLDEGARTSQISALDTTMAAPPGTQPFLPAHHREVAARTESTPLGAIARTELNMGMNGTTPSSPPAVTTRRAPWIAAGVGVAAIALGGLTFALTRTPSLPPGLAAQGQPSLSNAGAKTSPEPPVLPLSSAVIPVVVPVPSAAAALDPPPAASASAQPSAKRPPASKPPVTGKPNPFNVGIVQ